MSRRDHGKLLPLWFEETIATLGLVLVIGTLCALALYGYAVTRPPIP